MNEEYVNFGDVYRKHFGGQCQHGCRYTGIAPEGDGVHNTYWQQDGYPDLGVGLLFKGNTNNYHSLLIHKDDVNVFVKRYKKWVEAKMR